MNRAINQYTAYLTVYIPSHFLLMLKSEYSSTVFDMRAGFLRVIYSRLNASVILERNETRLERNETRLERNETRLERNETHLARNETRSGNLHLSGTVCCLLHMVCSDVLTVVVKQYLLFFSATV